MLKLQLSKLLCSRCALPAEENIIQTPEAASAAVEEAALLEARIIWSWDADPDALHRARVCAFALPLQAFLTS